MIIKNMDNPLLEISGLKKYYPLPGRFVSGQQGFVKALDGVDIQISNGETLGLVGESGCGKSTLGRLILRLEEKTAGIILFEGEEVADFRGETLKQYRKKAQIIFQDPYASLNPRMTAGSIIGEPLLVHGVSDDKSRREQVRKLMEVVGLSQDQAGRYPHEFSGGQRQRIGIARAVALKPKLIIADEPVSALDVSIQAQILNLLTDLQKDFGLTYLFITHDLAVVRHISDRIAVMYLGRIVEIADRDALYGNPLHPYTKALLSAVPVADPEKRKERILLPGDIPSPLNPPPGCSFHPRCPCRMDVCQEVTPPPKEIEKGHIVSCHLMNIR